MATAKKTNEAVDETIVETVETVAEGPAEFSEAWYNEKVPVRLFKDNGKYKDDVFVCVNGRSMLIQRGKTVMVPRKFALVIEQSDEQREKAANIIDAKSSEYANEAKAHGV